jgi:hypothetical protein
MAQIKERYQNPVVNDTVRLRLHIYNQNNPAEIVGINKVELWYLDENNRSEENPDGRRLVETFDGSRVVCEDTGQYALEVPLESPKYVIGKYFDIWTVQFTEEDEAATPPQPFAVYPNLFYTTPLPVVYDFSFHFQPNKLRRGSKQFIQIEVVPNVPKAKELQRYYENLAIAADLKISMEETACNGCAPNERDLRLILDEEPIDYRERRWGFYKLDTEDMACGIYNVWFRLDFGGNTYISDKMQLMIYE